MCVTRDPESGIQNMGTYRAALKATDRLAVRMVAREATGAGGYLHWLKYRKAGQKMPIAIVIGCAPVVMFTGPQKLAVDLDELGVAGALAGAPIRIAKAKTIDLDVPADSEIVVEGRAARASVDRRSRCPGRWPRRCGRGWPSRCPDPKSGSYADARAARTSW